SSPSTSSPASSNKCRHSCPEGSNTPLTVSASAPLRIISVLARAPASSPSESTTIDLPAPVSPERMFSPGPKPTEASARTARLRIWISRSTRGWSALDQECSSLGTEHIRRREHGALHPGAPEASSGRRHQHRQPDQALEIPRRQGVAAVEAFQEKGSGPGLVVVAALGAVHEVLLGLRLLLRRPGQHGEFLGGTLGVFLELLVLKHPEGDHLGGWCALQDGFEALRGHPVSLGPLSRPSLRRLARDDLRLDMPGSTQPGAHRAGAAGKETGHAGEGEREDDALLLHETAPTSARSTSSARTRGL